MAGLRGKLARLERKAAVETIQARCGGCGEERRIRADILLDVAVLEWRMHQDGAAELPADTLGDVRWVASHPCDPLLLRDRATGESVFGPVWERGVRANREKGTNAG
jgi:hypothetical protein